MLSTVFQPKASSSSPSRNAARPANESPARRSISSGMRNPRSRKKRERGSSDAKAE